MNCIICGKPLRKCKRLDVIDRRVHFSCIDLELKIREKEAEYYFIKWFKERIRIHLRLTQM